MSEFSVLKNILTDNSKYLISIFIFYIVDFLTGFSKAFKNKKFSSEKLRGSVSKALEYTGFIFVGVIAVYLFNFESAVKIIIISLCGIELSSICENANELGFKFPKSIINLFERGTGE